MKCLVTGAAGFIGSALANRLSAEGYEIKALIHKNKPEKLNDKIEYISGDILDKESLKPAIKDVDFIFHCAAHVKDYGPKKKFYQVNVEGTKNIVELCEQYKIKRLVYLSHQQYESENKLGHYSRSKRLAEKYLIEKYEKEKLPVVIIRPGNVYGPGANIWVLRILDALKKNRIALIDNGSGIFLHTYIDNLLDALIASLKEDDAIGKIIDITDGKNNTTWKEYFDFLAKISDTAPISRNMSKKTALAISKIMVFFHHIFRIDPIVTPTAVYILTNKKKISIDEATHILNYGPKVDFEMGKKRTTDWLKAQEYID
jgi:nucleoside-diphosphate-sugar epimerase